LTATSAPCTSIFKPVWLDSGLPSLGPLPTAIFTEGAFWWQHETLHRAILLDYPKRIKEIQDEINAFQAEVLFTLPQNLFKVKQREMK